MNDFKEMIAEYAKLLPVGTSISYTEAERRAGEFLVAQAKVTDLKHIFSKEKIAQLSLQTATYANEMSKGTSKTVTENKLNAEASEAYIAVRESLEEIENDIAYLKTYYEIFNNAHIFFRNLSKEN